MKISITRFEKFIRSRINKLEKCIAVRSQYCIPRFSDQSCLECEKEFHVASTLPRGVDE